MYTYNTDPHNEENNIEEMNQDAQQSPSYFNPYQGRRPKQPNPGYPPNRPPFERPGYQPRPDNYGGGKPSGPPPSYTPRKSPSQYKVDPGSIYGCLYKYTYVWLENGRSFWMYPTFIGRKSVAGYRWGRFGWAYIGLDLDLIESFSCSAY